MAAKAKIHVMAENDRWVVRNSTDPIAKSRHSTQNEALQAARILAREEHCELFIHRLDGEIEHRELHFPQSRSWLSKLFKMGTRSA